MPYPYLPADSAEPYNPPIRVAEEYAMLERPEEARRTRPRVSPGIGALSGAFAETLGMLLGLVAGYFRGVDGHRDLELVNVARNGGRRSGIGLARFLHGP